MRKDFDECSHLRSEFLRRLKEVLALAHPISGLRCQEVDHDGLEESTQTVQGIEYRREMVNVNGWNDDRGGWGRELTR